MMVSTNEAFLDQIKAAQILSPDELKRAAASIDEQDDTKSAARKLVSAGLLSRWQAGQLLKGGRPTLVLGKYVLLDRLPWGSSHAVFLAKHPIMDRKVALSVLDKSSSARSEAVKSFLADARAIAALDHRHLIHVYNIDEADNRYFLVMEHVEGRNLHDAVKASGPMSVEVAADVLRQIADGLDHAHRAKLVHGGLRPTNVLLDSQGVVKIIDLGAAKLDDPTKPPEKNGNSDSQVMEIADFLSPEQAAGGAATPQSDLYSLGCLGYTLLTGAAPFGSGDYAQRLSQHQSGAVPDVRSRRKDAPDGLAQILQKLMAKSPSERFASAKDVVSELERWWSEVAAQFEAAKPKPKPVAKPAPAKPSPAAAAKPGSVPAPKPSAAKFAPVKPAAKPAGVEAEESADDDAPAFPGINLRPAKRSGAVPAFNRAAIAPAAEKDDSADGSDDDTVAAPVVGKKKSKSAPPPLPAATSDSDEQLIASAPTSGLAVSPASHAKSRSKLPLILAMVGGGLLLFFGGVGLTAYLLSGDRAPVTAIAPVDDQQKTGEDDKEPEDESAGTETKPPDDGDETPAPPDDDPDGEDDGETGEVVPPVVPPDPPTEQPVDPIPPVDPPTTDPPPTDPPPTEPPKTDPPPTDPPTTTPPATDPPKGPSPFAALTAAVTLPSLKEEQKAPVALGPVSLPADATCYIDLVGGDKALPKEGVSFSMDLARNGLAQREWEIKLVGGPKGDTIVANLALTDKDLTFQWTPDAQKIDDAGYLANCKFNLRNAEHEHYITLRQPQDAMAIPINLTRALHREKFEIPYAANPDTIVVEIVKVDGIEKTTIEPKQQLTAKQDSTFIWFAEGEDRVLGLKFDANMQKDLQLTITPVITDPIAGTTNFVAKKVSRMKAPLIAASAQINASLQSLKARADKDKLADTIGRQEQQLAGVTKSLETFDKLEKQFEAAHNKASVQFRVFYTDGEHQVDLVRGTQSAAQPVAPPVVPPAEAGAEAGAKKNG